MTVESRFNTVAAQYAAGRPDYPPGVYDAIDAALPRPLAGADVVDLGAGTGIATRQLLARGARVVPVELSAQMLEQLVLATPGISAVRGDGHALPLRSGVADLVTCAQAWHWIDPVVGLPEIRRVLRPGGVFAAWWNSTHRESKWENDQQTRIEAADPAWHNYPNAREAEPFTTEYGLSVSKHDFFWERTISVEAHLANLVSRSYVAALPNRDEFVANERRILTETFPDGTIPERFEVLLVLVSGWDGLRVPSAG